MKRPAPVDPLEALSESELQALLDSLPGMPVAEQQQLLEDVDRLAKNRELQRCRDDFLAFCHRVYPGAVFDDNGTLITSAFKEGPHHRHMAKVYHEVCLGDQKRVTVSMPPRFGKSEFTSYLFVAWYFGHHPDHQVMMVTHTEDLSSSFGRKVRDLIDSPVYAEIFPDTEISKDKKASGSWTTTRRGVYLALGVGGAAAGKGADLLLCDDLCVAPDTLLTTPFGDVRADCLREGDRVLGVEGWVRVTWVRRTVHERTVHAAGVTMSPEHPVWVFYRGWTEAQSLRASDVLQTTSFYDKIKSYIRGLYEPCTKSLCRLFARVQHLGHDEAALQQSSGSQLQGLRGTGGDRGYSVEAVRRLFSGYGPSTVAATHLGPQGPEQRVHPRKLSVVRRGDAAEQQAQFAPVRLSRGAPFAAADRPSTQNRAALVGAQGQENGDVGGASAAVSERQLGAAPRHSEEFGRLRCWGARVLGRSSEIVSDAVATGGWRAKAFVVGDEALHTLLRFFVGVRRAGNVVNTPPALLVCLSVNGSNTFYANGVLTHNCSEQAVLADPETAFENAWTYMQVGPLQRLMPGGRILMIATRWGKMDPIGRALKWAKDNEGSIPWHEIRFPAIINGKSLWPQQWSFEELMAKKANMRLAYWNAQYMQEPTSDEAAILKRSYWKRWTKPVPPVITFTIQTWDTAHEKKTRNDHSACITGGVFFNEQTGRDNIILLNAVKKRVEYPDLKRMVKIQAREWKPDSLIIEKKAAGAPLIQELKRVLMIEEYNPSRKGRGVANDKIARANAVSPILEEGLVWAPETSWAEEVIEDCNDFPNGDSDDLVDCLVMLLDRFRRSGFLRLADDDEDNEDEDEAEPSYDYY